MLTSRLIWQGMMNAMCKVYTIIRLADIWFSPSWQGREGSLCFQEQLPGKANILEQCKNLRIRINICV